MNLNITGGAIMHSLTSLVAGRGNPKKTIAALFGKHRPYGEDDLGRLTHQTEILEAKTDEREDGRTIIRENNDWLLSQGPSMTKKKTFMQWMSIICCPPLIVGLVTAGVTSFVTFIRENSLDPSLGGALGLTLSLWAFSPSLKFFMGDVLAPWERPLKIIIFIIMTGAFVIGGLELTGHFMIDREDGGGGLNAAGVFAGAEQVPTQTKVTSFRAMYFAVSLLEAIGVYALVSVFGNAFGPHQSSEVLKTMKANQKLRLEDKRLTKEIAVIGAEVAILKERKRRADAIEAIIKKFFDKD